MVSLTRLSQLALLAFLGACSALDQAPLVYSTNTSFGIDLSSTSAANPGVSINIGYKQVNVAYVPVAVAASAANRAASDIVVITAGFDESGIDQQQARADRKAKANVYERAFTDFGTASSKQQSDQNTLSALVAEQGAISSALAAIKLVGVNAPTKPLAVDGAAGAPSAAAAADWAFQLLLATRTTQIKSSLLPPLGLTQNVLSDTLPVPTATSDLTALQQALIDRNTKLNKLVTDQQAVVKGDADVVQQVTTKREQAKADLEAIDRQLATQKKDAMSVYGSFNGAANAEAAASSPGAGLTVGNVFSTGVASQNLTEAARVAAVASCISKSMLAVNPAAAASSALTSDVATAIIATCGRAASRS